MMALLPLLRSLGDDVPKRAARQFGRVAWPFFGLVVATGIWSLLVIDASAQTTGYNATLGIKMLLVAISGSASFAHSSTSSRVVRGATGAGSFLAGLAAFYCGVLLVT